VTEVTITEGIAEVIVEEVIEEDDGMEVVAVATTTNGEVSVLPKHKHYGHICKMLNRFTIFKTSAVR
jgi:hypothetical protein